MDRAPPSTPDVSVVIPTYNRATLLREAVASVVAQTFSSWELIIVDDGSTDDTVPYLRGLRDPRIRIVEHAHCAMPSVLRNAAIDQARGRLVAFLDSDDVWEPAKLATQLTTMSRNPDARWSYTYFRHVDEAGASRPLPADRSLLPCEGWIFEQVLTLTASIALPTVIVERSLLREVGGFSETLRFSEDYDLWLRLARRSPVVVVPQALTAVRQHPGNTWRSHGATPLEPWVGTYQRIVDDPDPALLPFRPAARRMHARATVSLADRYRAESQYSAGVRALLRAAPGGIVLRAWWMALAKTSLRGFMPARALRLYRALSAR